MNSNNVVIGDRVKCTDSLVTAEGVVVMANDTSILLEADTEGRISDNKFICSDRNIEEYFPDFDVLNRKNCAYYMFMKSSIIS